MVYRSFITTCFVIFILTYTAHSFQKKGWTQYFGYQSAKCVASLGGVCWIGNYGGGLFKHDVKSGEVTQYTNLNSALPSNLVNDITIGPDSVVWIATAGGLALFDGHSWKVFDRNNAPFICNSIKALCIDDQGTVWVSSVSGFYCYRNAQWVDILEKYPGFPLEVLSGATKIFSAGSEIWLQFSNYHVCFNNGKWERFSGLTGLCISRDRTCWYLSTTDRALIGLRGDAIETIKVPASILSGILFIDSSDTKWVYRNDTLYYQKSDQWETIAIPQTFRGSYYYTFLRMDNAQYIWLNTTDALLRYSPSLNEWKTFPIGVSTDYRYYNSTKITLDMDSRLWIINSNGLFLSNSDKWSQYDMLEKFSGAYPKNIELDKTGRLHTTAWQGINNELKLYAAVKNDRTIEGAWTYTQCTFDASSSFMSCFNLSDNAWIYNTNSYLSGYAIKLLRDGKCLSLPYPGDTLISLNDMTVTDNGTVWALMKNKLLFRYKNGAWEKPNAVTSISLDTITGILGAAGDTLWISAGKAGLVRFDGTYWKSFEVKTASSNIVNPLYYDRRRGELWCTVNNKYKTYNNMYMSFYQTYSGEGMYCFNGVTGTMYTPANSGIFDADIKSIVSDSSSLWVASTYGIAHWDRGQSAVSSKMHNNMSSAPVRQQLRVQSMENKRIELNLDSPALVSVSVFNLTGRLVRTIDAGKRNAGYNVITLSGVDMGNARNVYVFIINVKELSVNHNNYVF